MVSAPHLEHFSIFSLLQSVAFTVQRLLNRTLEFNPITTRGCLQGRVSAIFALAQRDSFRLSSPAHGADFPRQPSWPSGQSFYARARSRFGGFGAPAPDGQLLKIPL